MTTLAPTSHRAAAPTGSPRWSFAGVLSSEITKLVTLRSTFVIAAVMLVTSVGFAALVAATFGVPVDGRPASPADDATASALGSAVSFSQLVIGILAVLIVSNEYTTNMIQSTLTATPKRLPVLAAKLIVVSVATVVLSVVSALLGYLASAPILASNDLLVPLTDGRVVGAIAGTTLYLLIVAVFSACVASIVRNSAAGIAIMAGAFFVLPILLSLLPESSAHLPDLVLGNSAQTLDISLWQDYAASIGKAVAVTAVWIAVPAVAAFALLSRRDA